MDNKNRKCSERYESGACVCSEDLAEELEDVDLAEAGDDDGWETEDEMESEQDDSDLSFSKHTGDSPHTSASVRNTSSFISSY